jgi:hypothetical protein
MPNLTLSKRGLTHKDKTENGLPADRRPFLLRWLPTVLCICLLAGCASSGEDVTEQVTTDPFAEADLAETDEAAEADDSLSGSGESEYVSGPAPNAAPSRTETLPPSLSRPNPNRVYR